jgi:hypothetical protein
MAAAEAQWRRGAGVSVRGDDAVSAATRVAEPLLSKWRSGRGRGSQRRTWGRRGDAGLEVGDGADRWSSGERRQDWAVWAERRDMPRGEEKEGEGGEWAVGRMGKGKGFGVCFFPFLFLFQILFKQLFKPLFKSNLLLVFHNLFQKLF